MDTGLKGRVALVTGSSSGIGRATAMAFGEEGARVAVTYRSNRQGAEATAARVERAGGKALVVPYDLNDSDSIRTAVRSVARRWGTIHVLVNNAVQWGGGAGPDGSVAFEDVPADAWRPMLRSTLEGVYHTIQAVVPWMRGAAWGRIVNVSSTVAEDGLPGSGAYAAAKSGLHGLTNVLAVELGPDGILTNVVMPGLTRTERAVEVIPASVRERVAGATPTRRLTTPQEVARLVVFLGSRANGHVNGEALRITGGA